MRNFGKVRTVIAKRDVRTIRLGAVSGIVANAASAHCAVLVSPNACRRSFELCSGVSPYGVNGNLVNSAGLTLMGYPDTSGAPSANLRR